MTKRCGAKTGLVMGVLLFLVLVPPGLVAQAKSYRSSLELTPEHLLECDLHLPSYMPTILGIMRYQSALEMHQKFTVTWDSLPGYTSNLYEHEASRLPVASDVVIVERERMASGGLGMSHPALTKGDIVVAAVTANAEVRGLVIVRDPRLIQGQIRLIVPKVTFDFGLPEDPQIIRVLLLRTVPNGQHGWRLERVGELDLTESH